MQKIISSLVILVLCLAGVPAVFGSPLVFKAAKEIKSNEWAELAIFDTSKFKQIRVGVIDDTPEASALNISAVEDVENVFIAGTSADYLNYSVLIDAPPTKIKISVKGKGTYKIFIWAS